MTDNDATGRDQDTEGTPPRRTALVPFTRPQEAHATCYVRARPDSSFVTHLIATAAQMPQTCTLRRASPADAQASYRAAARRTTPQPAARASGTSRVA